MSNAFWNAPIYSLWNRYGVHTSPLVETQDESDFSSIEERINEGEMEFSEFCENSQLKTMLEEVK